MALTISNVLQCPKPHLSQINCFKGKSASNVSSSRVRFPRRHVQKLKVICTAASPSGSSSPDGDSNPYEVLGVSPVEGFDTIKTAYSRKRKEAERRGDEATANRVS
ncbi:hypothetical protein IFM89_036230 [Coptis chinensis]|uniref:Uncharacterized protein n=1 Tax=Coptis chinensis TaxID=261450 RepID=A0A835ISW8_9MAGN|nr:hypothetical protein IFM89_036230 [Coptis chinensis]